MDQHYVWKDKDVKGKFLATVPFFSFVSAEQCSRSGGALHAVTFVSSTPALPSMNQLNYGGSIVRPS